MSDEENQESELPESNGDSVEDETEKILSELLEESDPEDNLTAMLEKVSDPNVSDEVFSGMAEDSLSEAPAKPKHQHGKDLERVLKIKVPLQVILSEKAQSIHETINLQVGSLIEFDKYSDEELDVYINNQRFGTGEVVKINECFGVRIKSIVTVEEKIRKLGV